METILVNGVEKNLNQFMFKNAIFLCERLCAEFPSEVNMQLLARCYLGNNQAYCAYYILKGLKAPQSRYLFALSCVKLDHLVEAEAALLPGEDDVGEVAGGAAGNYLLGLIYRYTGRRHSSVEHFRMVLLLDPLFWEAYEELCMLGVAEEASSVFGEVALQRIQETYLGQTSSFSQRTIVNEFSDSDKTLKDSKLRHNEHFLGNGQQSVTLDSSKQLENSSQTNNSDWNTPSPVPPQVPDVAPPQLRKNLRAPAGEKMVPERLYPETRPRRSARIAARRKINMSQSSGSDADCLHASSSESNSATSLSSMIEKCRIESSKEATTSGQTISGTGNSVDDEENSRLTGFESGPSSIIFGISEVLNLLRLLGECHRHLLMYNCEDALFAYEKLSEKQYNTQWVLSQVGKAYFQLQDYFKADSVFLLAHQMYPYALEGMDIYSTVLYHLKEEMRLGYLAQELLSIDRLAPESWCALGNCYSLQKDHEAALKIFHRAIRLNQRFAYAHTLCGHEFAALEEYGDAERCYRKALDVDERHYNAWHGLGMIYLRQEKFEFAQHHFQRALRINPRSSVIMCYNGIALHESKRSDEALETLDQASISDSRNPLPIYYKANVLVGLGKYEEAAKVLEELKDCVPHESSVHGLLGKIYVHMKLYDKAVFHFGIALDLNPSAIDAVHIKACMERLIAPEELEDYI
ncbi:PREDICTED: cell division cycle protein 27 homolog A isoform X2 [Tarenaya hassleriana]|uniref:cell division cycle protein 27 homolog A isoform X2 n=1 Tax=Tarenaya hassleriana TaxID=28532 RepID=UPI00053C4EE0|nr:PREDICTED: cell division cycle protein 27 homolog A isoform X2 [Tarenaya hassleriana]